MVTVMLGIAKIEMISVEELFELSLSPPPDTDAVFATVAGAFPATDTLRVIGGATVCAGIACDRVQVTLGPPRMHDQPNPEALTAVSPVGSVSVTVTRPDVSVPPVFDTTMEKGADDCPCVKLPECVFEIDSAGTAGHHHFGFVYRASFAGLTLTTPTGKKVFNRAGAATQQIEEDLFVTKGL